MNKFFYLLALIPCIAQAQNDGIRFEHGLSWKEIKVKAAAEHKYIFLDCYATWCGPCKWMDQNVYNIKSIGEEVNSHFISVKVQLDKSKQDSGDVQKWYDDAENIQNEYKINAFPTYLFFSPYGKLVHKDLGAKYPEDFLVLTAAALDSNRQYYTLLDKYKSGQKIYPSLACLAETTKRFDDTTAVCMAKDYLYNYLYKAIETELFQKENIEFITYFDQLLKSDEKYFGLFYRHPKELDSAMGRTGFAQREVEHIIRREEIYSRLMQDGKRTSLFFTLHCICTFYLILRRNVNSLKFST